MKLKKRFSVVKFKNPSGKIAWKVTGTLNGERIRQNFKTKAEADGEAERLDIKAANGDTLRLAPTTLSDLQIAEAQDAFDRLGSKYSMRMAVDYFLDNYQPPKSYLLMKDVLEDFYEAKRSAGVRERSITQLKSTLTRVSKEFEELLIHEIKLVHLQAYVGRQGWTRKTQNNFRADVSSFFEWCRTKPREWIQENPAKDLPKFKIERGIPQILRFKEAKELMEYVAEEDSELVPYFALALFAGIRPQYPGGELGKIASMKEEAWSLIDFQNKVIRIPPEISKTGEYRTINIQPNLAVLLRPFAKKKASILVTNFEKRLKKIRAKKNLGHDVLRHTFISMHVAKFKSVGATALQAGNSEAIVRRHYLKMVAESEARMFWKIGV